MNRLAFLIVPALFATAEPAAAWRSDWVDVDNARLRLIASREAGVLIAGIEIVLEPGWHTYWINPGEAGVPPQFDFSGSENLAAVAVRFPTPERYFDGMSTSVIYRDQVVFPLATAPADPGRAVQVELKASIGVCREICIPAEAEARLSIPPGDARDPLAAALIANFSGSMPGPPRPGVFEVVDAVLEDDAVSVSVRMPASGRRDLFLAEPAEWFVPQPEPEGEEDGLLRYRLAVVRGAESLRGQAFRFVAVSGGEAIEQTVAVR